MKDLKNVLTNIIGIVTAIAGVLSASLGSVPDGAEWYVVVGAVVIGLFGYFTGKDKNLKAKVQ